MKRIITGLRAARFRAGWVAPVGFAVLVAAVTSVWAMMGSGATSAQSESTSSSASVEQSAASKAQSVDVVPVRSESYNRAASYPGTLRASQTATLAFRVGGPLVNVEVAPGTQVAAGDLMMRIDPRDYENAVASAQAQLDSALAKLAAMEVGARAEDIRALDAKRLAAVARQEYARAEFERNQRLLNSNAVARAEFDASKASLTAAESDLKAAIEELQKARTGSRDEDITAMKADIRALESQLKIARDQLSDTDLRAPFPGIVTRQLVENHEQVAPGQTVVALHDIDMLEVDVSLPEKEILHRPLDSQFDAEVRLVTMPSKVFAAQFKEIDTEADPRTRTYQVTFVMPKPKGLNVLPGMVVDLLLSSASSEAPSADALIVPMA